MSEEKSMREEAALDQKLELDDLEAANGGVGSPTDVSTDEEYRKYKKRAKPAVNTLISTLVIGPYPPGHGPLQAQASTSENAGE